MLTRNDRGMAVLPILFMVAAASVGFAYYLMGQQELATKQKSKTLVKDAVDAAAAVIKTSLALSDICTQNLMGQTKGFEPNIINDSFGNKIVQVGDVYSSLGNGIKLTKMRVDAWTNPQTNETADYFYVNYDVDPFNRKKLIGGKSIGRKFRLRGRKNLTLQTFEFCYHEESNFVELSAKKNCEDMLGVWNNWVCSVDPNTFLANNSLTCPSGNFYFTIVSNQLTLACAP